VYYVGNCLKGKIMMHGPRNVKLYALIRVDPGIVYKALQGLKIVYLNNQNIFIWLNFSRFFTAVSSWVKMRVSNKSSNNLLEVVLNYQTIKIKLDLKYNGS